jgi:hypothetical protein
VGTTAGGLVGTGAVVGVAAWPHATSRRAKPNNNPATSRYFLVLIDIFAFSSEKDLTKVMVKQEWMDLYDGIGSFHLLSRLLSFN